MNSPEPRDEEQTEVVEAARDKPTGEMPTQPFSKDESHDDPPVLISAESNLHSARTELLTPSGEAANFDTRGSLNDFQILEELGSGTFGVVFRARDLRLDREVAIKLIKDDQIGNKSRIQNFRAEARAAAQLRHPNIVPVHQAGDIGDGQTFIVYGFIQGQTLRGYLREKKQLDRHEAVALLTSVCEGLGYAHSVGIVHRDVKPENILIEESTGEPLLADFGCATRTSLKQTLGDSVLSNVFIGTPPYFSPEQAAGRSHEADARSDVWTLGIILDELITGRRTFRQAEKSASHVTQLLKDIREARPSPLRERAPHVDRDLDAIWNKCLEQEPDKRYDSAAELADDLKRWQRKEPVAARPLGPLERISRWAARNPLIAASLTTVFTTILIAFIVSLGFYLEAVYTNRARVQIAVNLFLAKEPNELVETLNELGQPYNSIAPDTILGKWSQLNSRDRSTMSAEEQHHLWRLAMGGSVLHRDPPADVLEHFTNRLFSESIPPAEFDAAIDAVVARSANCQAKLSDEAARLLNHQNQSAPDARLRALWYGVKTDDGTDPSAVAEPLAECLYQLAANDDPNVESWLNIFEPLHAEAKAALSSLLANASSANRRTVLRDLLDAIENQPGELLTRIANSQAPLTALADRLKRRLDERQESYSFADFTDLALPDDQLPSPRALARLWLAYLIVSDENQAANQAADAVLDGWDRRDPTSASWFIKEVADSAIKPSKLARLARTWQAANDDRLANAILAVGNCSGGVPEDLSSFLIRLATDTPDATVHAACVWTLKNRGVDVPEFAIHQYGERNWRYLPSLESSAQQMFVRVDRPTEPVSIGTPENLLREIDVERLNPAATDNELLHYRKLAFPFEIAAQEVTVSQFQQFAEDRLERVGNCPRLASALGKLDQDGSKPAHELTWHDAIEYCVWLSNRYGLESCYGPIDDINEASEYFRIVPCDRSKNGFRLPTNGEWELACRAGSTTLWSFGDSERLADEYVVHSKPRHVLEVVASLKPNQLGLFDMLGNAREWTEDLSRPYPSGEMINEPEQRQADSATISFDVRGGGASDQPRKTRSGRRFADFFAGLRVVRTLSP